MVAPAHPSLPVGDNARIAAMWRRRRQRVRLGALGTCLYVAGFAAGTIAIVMPLFTLLWAIGAGIVALFLGVLIAIPVAARKCRVLRAREADYRICPTCRGPLAESSPDRSSELACTPCNKRYTRESLVRAWERTDEKAANAKRWPPLSQRAPIPLPVLAGLLPAAVGLLLALIVMQLGIVPRSMAPMSMIFIGPLTAIFAPMIVRRDARDFTRIKEKSFRVCPECLADLPLADLPHADLPHADLPQDDVTRTDAPESGGGAPSRCASCTHAYTPASLESVWTAAYAHVANPAKSGRYPTDRGTRKMAITFGLTMLGIAIALAIINRFVSLVSLPRAALGALIAALVVIVIVFIALIASRSSYGHTRLLRLRAHAYRFCPECGYDLRQSPDAGPCPECGIAYDPESLRLRWESEPKAEVPRL